MRYSRDFEKQADIMGAQIMARAGYDPRALAQMFETIAKESHGEASPQWMSSHPDPGNRSQYIVKEAEALTIATAADTSGFQQIHTLFAALPPPKPMSDKAPANAHAAADESAPPRAVGTPGLALSAPSGQYRDISGGKVFRASVPSNWADLPSNSSIKVVPQNGYGDLKGQTVFTCGVEFGIVKAATRDLQEATKTWLQGIAQSNPELRLAGEQQSVRMSQRSALATPLVNPSPLGGRELIGLYTTFLADGTMFYYITMVPEKDADTFRETFRHIGESIRLTEVR
jgi:hypothetical protein